MKTAHALYRDNGPLMSRTMAVHVRFEYLYIFLPSSAKQQREITKSCVLLGACTAMVCFSCLPFEFYPIIPHSNVVL